MSYKLKMLFAVVLFVILASISLLLRRQANAKLPTPTEYSQYIDMPENAAHLNGIYNRGIARGNIPGVFSKIGASTTGGYENLVFVGIDETRNLGNYQYLQETVDYFSAVPIWNEIPGWATGYQNSFTRGSWSATGGLMSGHFISTGPHPRSVFRCIGITLLDCEYTKAHPTIAFIDIGTNDLGSNFQTSPDVYKANMETIIDYTMSRDIIPILLTLPRRCDYVPKPTCNPNSVVFNEIIRELAEDRGIPLVDFGAAIDMLPDWGLERDWIHPVSSPEVGSVVVDGITYGPARIQSGNLTDPYLIYAMNRRNLLSLLVLDELRKVLAQGRK